MDAHTPLIRVRDVGYAYPDGRHALRGVSFSLEAGDRMGIIGANGSGKTTLLSLIMGLLPEFSGDLEIFGEKRQRDKDFREVRRRIGFVFQNADDQLFCPTVIEDVAFGPLNLGKSPKEARKIAEATLERLGLAGFADRVCHRLSGGEKKLVSLATVLSMDPEVLLLDEPTTGLDEETRARIVAILSGLPVSMLIVSHEYDFLARLTSRVLAVEKGRIVADGDRSLLHTHTHFHPLGSVPHKH